MVSCKMDKTYWCPVTKYLQLKGLTQTASHEDTVLSFCDNCPSFVRKFSPEFKPRSVVHYSWEIFECHNQKRMDHVYAIVMNDQQ